MNSRHRFTLLEEIEPVIARGICVGCGACAVAGNGGVVMTRTPDGACAAQVSDREKAGSAQGGICPFSDHAPNEDAHATRLFGDAPMRYEALGFLRAAWAGHCAEGEFREHGSSGGIATWLAAEALRLGLVDAVLHVHPGTGADLFAYGLSRTVEDVRAGAKTRYYSVDFTDAFREVRATEARFALVGVPCFIKAARNLSQVDDSLATQMVLTISLVCGHMKSAGFAQSLAWQVGIAPDQIEAVDFRVKIDGVSASQYGFSATNRRSGTVVMAPMARLAGRRWDGGYHRMKACDYCDDVFGETADVTLGDAWLPEFSKDHGGTNVVVVRSAQAASLLDGGVERGALALWPLDVSRAVASQAGGVRDRREGLAYRLQLDADSGKWHPVKRVMPGSEGLTALRKLNYRLRLAVRSRSAANLAFCKRVGSIEPYRLEMSFWHACFRLLQIAERRIAPKAPRKE